MSQQDVETEILKPMQGIYLPPRQFSEEMVKENLVLYAKALDGFSREDLQYAWTNVAATHTGRAWPVIGQFVTYAARNKNDRMSRQPGSGGKGEAKKQNEAWKNWERVRNLPVAKEAAQKGVSWSLKCEILSGKNPGSIDLARLVQARARANRLYWKIKQDGPIWSERLQQNTVMRDPVKTTVLAMYEKNLENEAATALEVNFTGQADAVAEPLDVEALVG